MPPRKKTNRTKLPSITQLPSGAYHAKIYEGTDANGKRIYRSFTNYDYAALTLELAQFKAERKDKRIDHAYGRSSLTLGDAISQYIESKNAVLSPATVKEYRSLQKNHFQDLMNVKLFDITALDLQTAVNQMALSRSPKTVRNAYALITATLQTFRPDFNPRITLPQKKKVEMEIPTEDEINRLLAVADGTEMYIPILLGACCGMRRSEIAALKWGDIDFKKETLTIRHALVLNDQGEFVEKGTKTFKGHRTIRLFPLVLEQLKKVKASTNAGSNDRVTISPSKITDRFQTIQKNAGTPHYRFHALRHYTVSVMLSLNIPKKYIADYVGHETEHMIDQVYGHIMQSKKTSVEDLMQTYFSEHLRNEMRNGKK